MARSRIRWVVVLAVLMVGWLLPTASTGEKAAVSDSDREAKKQELIDEYAKLEDAREKRHHECVIKMAESMLGKIDSGRLESYGLVWGSQGLPDKSEIVDALIHAHEFCGRFDKALATLKGYAGESWYDKWGTSTQGKVKTLEDLAKVQEEFYKKGSGPFAAFKEAVEKQIDRADDVREALDKADEKMDAAEEEIEKAEKAEKEKKEGDPEPGEATKAVTENLKKAHDGLEEIANGLEKAVKTFEKAIKDQKTKAGSDWTQDYKFENDELKDFLSGKADDDDEKDKKKDKEGEEKKGKDDKGKKDGKSGDEESGGLTGKFQEIDQLYKDFQKALEKAPESARKGVKDDLGNLLPLAEKLAENLRDLLKERQPWGCEAGSTCAVCGSGASSPDEDDADENDDEEDEGDEAASKTSGTLGEVWKEFKEKNGVWKELGFALPKADTDVDAWKALGEALKEFDQPFSADKPSRETVIKRWYVYFPKGMLDSPAGGKSKGDYRKAYAFQLLKKNSAFTGFDLPAEYGPDWLAIARELMKETGGTDYTVPDITEDKPTRATLINIWDKLYKKGLPSEGDSSEPEDEKDESPSQETGSDNKEATISPE